LILGLGCLFGAAVTGEVFRTESLFDWQAIQVRRIEWLLAAAVILLAGILLKSKRAH